MSALKKYALSIAVLVGLGASLTAPSYGAPDVAPKKGKIQSLKKKRLQLIQWLKDYQKAGEFPGGQEGVKPLSKKDPHRNKGPVQTHRFRGPNGKLCALAYLIQRSGEKQLVEDIIKNDNHFCVAIDKNSKVTQWILQSGLTLEECIRIQEPGWEGLRGPAPDLATVLTEHLKQHLATVVSELEKNTDKSLELARKRLQAKS